MQVLQHIFGDMERAAKRSKLSHTWVRCHFCQCSLTHEKARTVTEERSFHVTFVFYSTYANCREPVVWEPDGVQELQQKILCNTKRWLKGDVQMKHLDVIFLQEVIHACHDVARCQAIEKLKSECATELFLIGVYLLNNYGS